MPSDSQSFPDVFRAELLHLKSRREKLEQAQLPDGSDAALNAAAEATVGEAPTPDAGMLLYEEALEADLCGIAISGGGVRSATFGLGVLQALAVANFLPKIDYISTVSGGGYIGSWFTAWIKRSGLKEVIQNLKPIRFDRENAENWSSLQPDAAPIRHLRLYSNYLAPRIGLLSLDSWVLVSIYLRNLLLNQLVLILILLSLFGVARTLVELFTWFHNAGDLTQVLGFVTALGLGLLFTSLIAFALVNRRQNLSALVIALMLTASVLASLWLATSKAQSWFLKIGDDDTAFLPLVAYWLPATLGIIHGIVGVFIVLGREISQTARKLHDSRESPGRSTSQTAAGRVLQNYRDWLPDALLSLILGIVAGGIGAACLLGMLFALQQSGAKVASYSVFGPPVLVGGFVLTNYLQIGLLGVILPRYDRERWSSLNARCHVVQVAWLAMMGITVFGPWLIDLANNGSWGTTIATVLSSSWIGTTVAGLWAGNSSTTGQRSRFSITNAIAQIAPYVFVVGGLLLISYASNELIERAYSSVAHECTSETVLAKKLESPYLQRLDIATCNIQIRLWSETSLSIPPIICLLGWTVCASLLGRALSSRVGVNAFSLHDLYALRLIRCYLGASRRRQPNPLTNLDPRDDFRLSELFSEADGAQAPFLGPFPILNGTLNRKGNSSRGTPEERQAEALSFQDRQGESFIFTPFHCGSTSTGYCETKSFADNIKIGTAVAVSGAAVSPNQGYHSSPAVGALLTMFNVRLGAWFGNPNKPATRNSRNPPSARLLYFIKEMMGITTADSDYVYVSDGGHFENMGVYELIRRRCRFIVAVDSWADPNLSRENLGRLVRQVRIDFGIRIEIDIDETRVAGNGFCQSHFAMGRIHYGDVHVAKDAEGNPIELPDLHNPNYHYDANEGVFVYLKVGLTGDEPNDLLNYQAVEPLFPHHPISDQFFDEAQFESYRQLGFHTVQRLFEGRPDTSAPEMPIGQMRALSMAEGEVRQRVADQTTRSLFEELFNRWMSLPANRRAGQYAQLNEEYAKLIVELRSVKELRKLADELYFIDSAQEEHNADERFAERLMVLQMMTLLGSVWFELGLDRNHLHPINSGWMRVFNRWLFSQTVQLHWNGVRDEFSKPFCAFVDMLQTRQ